ncbi:MAG: Trm112 family protein [Gemmatimonadaceae bacterium]
MFVELIESLCCPRDHEESPLVASASHTETRHIVHGTLGCPVCGAEFPIANGVARFGTPAPAAPELPSAEAAMRLAAFLELTDERGFALLCGRWGAHADQLRRLADTPLVLVNPPVGAEVLDIAAVLQVGNAMPIARGRARAAALDGRMAPDLARAIVECVRPGGRLVGSVSWPVPDGATELVRDDREWVAERAAASPPVSGPVSIKRSRPASPGNDQ